MNTDILSSTIRTMQQIKNNEPLFSEEDAYIEAKYQIEKYIELVGQLLSTLIYTF